MIIIIIIVIVIVIMYYKWMGNGYTKADFFIIKGGHRFFLLHHIYQGDAGCLFFVSYLYSLIVIAIIIIMIFFLILF